MKINKKLSIVLSVVCGLSSLGCLFWILYDMCQPLGSVIDSRTLSFFTILVCVVGFAVFTSAYVFFLCRSVSGDETVKRILRVFVVIFGGAGLTCGTYLAVFFLVPAVSIRLRTFFLCCFGVVYFALATIVSACESIESEKMKNVIVKATVIASFAVYVIMFFGFMVIFKAFVISRSFSFHYNKMWLSDALPYLVPFRYTFLRFKEAFSEGHGRIINLSGFVTSAIAYTPLAFFLPSLFKSQRRFDSFLVTIVFIIVATEFFQGMFGFGACKIDDFIFGTAFACLAFYILRRHSVIKWMEKRHLYF